jgi:hypothetical protein
MVASWNCGGIWQAYAICSSVNRKRPGSPAAARRQPAVAYRGSAVVILSMNPRLRAAP